MAKIILEFNDDEDNARLALDAWKWKEALIQMDNELRNTTKYGISILTGDFDSASDLEVQIASKLRERLGEITNNYNIKLYD